MKKFSYSLIGGIVVLALLFLAGTAVAQSTISSQLTYEQVYDRVCVTFPDGSGDCFKPESCSVIECGLPPGCFQPICVQEPCDIICPVTPTPTTTPDPTATPVPTEKVKCNRGIGNNSEGCDPGGSSGQGRGGGRRAGEDRDERHGPRK